MNGTRDYSPSLIHRFLSRLSDPGAERYNAFVQLRSFGRGSTLNMSRTPPKNCRNGEATHASDGSSRADVDAPMRHAV